MTVAAVAAARRMWDNRSDHMVVGDIKAGNVGHEIANFDASTPLPLASGALYFEDIGPTGGRPHHRSVPLIEWPAQPGSLPLPPVYMTP